jgi:O-succinylbenzoate synthase
MRIERVELREIPLALRDRFEISSGWRHDRRIVLLAVYGDGHVGWGECVAAEDPSYSYETTDTAWHILATFIIPAVLGSEPDSAADVLAPVDWIRGHRMAKAALEMAAWDLEAKTKDVPLRVLLGGAREEVAVGVSIGLQATDDALFAKIEGHLERGYRKIKIKIKPGRDGEMLAAVRRRFGDIPLMADANSAYRLTDLPRLMELDDLGLLMIEQPLAYDDYLDHAGLQSRLATPICLDESIRSVDDAQLALKLSSCRIINIKPGRVGGLASSKRIHDLCQEAGVAVWCGGMLESGVGRAHNLALATLSGFTIPGDISESRRYWERDIVEPEFEMSDGIMRVPDGPGIGVAVDQERIDAMLDRKDVFSA